MRLNDDCASSWRYRETRTRRWPSSSSAPFCFDGTYVRTYVRKYLSETHLSAPPGAEGSETPPPSHRAISLFDPKEFLILAIIYQDRER